MCWRRPKAWSGGISTQAPPVPAGLQVESTAGLIVGLLRHAASSVSARIHALARDTNQTEDEVLAGAARAGAAAAGPSAAARGLADGVT